MFEEMKHEKMRHEILIFFTSLVQVKRHIYLPFILKHRFQPLLAGALAFFISAVAHEVLVGIPTHTVEGWAFGGMMLQLPMIALTEVVIPTLFYR
jgi:hypothetical protein